MIEWLDGYWTAMRHVTAAQLTKNHGPTLVEWLSALGSAGAAFAAAFAAWLTWRIARRGWQTSIVSEKAMLVSLSNELMMELSQKSLDAEITRLELTYRHPKFDEHLPLWKDIATEIATTGERYRILAKSAVINSQIDKSDTMKELQKLRIDIATLRIQMFGVDKVQKGNLYRIAMLEDGKGYSREPVVQNNNDSSNSS